ncbi:MAG TPA: glycosyltransferase family 39 protein [Streptosporangiaceae bacterium]|nr:glycosyltransferase family 39 protein [Streptosporangiaceae bacterium]
MIVTGYVREDLAVARPAEDSAAIPAGLASIEGLAGRIARLAWCWPALLALILGLYQVGRPELWRDELASWSFASRPVPSLIASARHTGATQLAYYLLLHGWIAAFGDSAGAMRTLSALAMAAAAACVALVGRRLAGARAGLTAGLVFALVPSTSRFAQEIRFYALAVLVATLATLLLLRALDRPSGPRWAAYAACLALLGYVEVVALSVVAGHIAGAVLRSWHDHDRRQLRFLPAVAAGLAACLPLAMAGAAQARDQIGWISRPGLDLTDFSFFGRNLFYSTSVAAALIVLAVLAWAVAWREAAFMTALAVGPVAVVWLASQGSYSYFFPRYLLFTVGAWAILAGIGLSKLDARAAAAAVLVVAILGAGDQQLIRAPGAHSWPSFPAGAGGSYPDYAGAAAFIAPRARPGDGAVYQGGKHGQNFMMIVYGLPYYLSRNMPNGVPFPHQLFVARPAAEAGTLYPQQCRHPAACLGAEPRIWVVGNRHQLNPYRAVTPAQAAVLRPRYRLSLVKHVRGLTVFLLVRKTGA